MGIDPEIFKEFENKMRLQEALGETPLAKNPFFIRTMSDPVFTGNGTEGVEPGNTIYLFYFHTFISTTKRNIIFEYVNFFKTKISFRFQWIHLSIYWYFELLR